MKKQFQSKSVPRGTRTIWRYLGALFILFTFAVGNVMAAETVLFSSFSNTTASNYFKNYTVDGKTVSVATSGNISSSSGDYYCGAMGSTPSNNNANYVELTVTGATIKTVSILITGNGSNKTCQPALLGWEGAIASNTTADYVLVPASQVISNKGLSNAQWHQFDVHGNDLTKVRIYRAVKGVNVAGGSTSGTTYGNAQSLQFYGIRVELEGLTPVCPSGLTISSKDSKIAFTEGDPIELTAALSAGNGDISYQWYKGSVAPANAISGATNAKYQVASCTTADAGDYYCVASKTSCDDAVNSSAFTISVAADTKCFNMPAITSKPSDLASVTVTGGSLADVSTAKSLAMNAAGLKLDGNSVYLKVTLANASIVEGTKITVAWKNAGDGAGIALVNENLEAKAIDETGVATNGSVTHTFTAEEAANYADEFIIHRNASGTSIYVNAITVEDCGPAVIKHAVTLNYNDGVTDNGTLNVVEGKAAVKPADPTRGKYTFLGWFVGDTDNEYVWSTAVTGDITLKAHWQDPWTITFDADGGSEVADITVKHNTAADKPTDPTKDDNDFLGWFNGENAYDWTAVVTGNLNLKAHWAPIVAKYDVEYYDGETKIGTEAQVWANQHPTATGINTYKPLYTFVGWYTSSTLEGDPVALNTVTPVEGLKIYGKWAKAYASNADFEAYIIANTSEKDDSVKADTYVKSLNYALSKKLGTTFDANTSSNNGAYAGLKIKNSGTVLSWNVVAGKVVELKAGVMVANGSLSINGGAVTTIDGGSTASGNENFKNHLFYSATEALYTFTTSNGSAEVIKAITMRDPYQVSYNPHGADAIAAQYGTPSVTLPTPVNGTGVFKGWYDAETEGNKIGNAGAEYVPTANITLHAQWETLSSDNTLASWKIDGVAKDVPVSRILYIEEPYGVTPVISEAVATANVGLETPIATVAVSNTPVHYQDATEDFWYVQAEVTPQDPTAAHGYYQVRYTNAPKLGATIFKAELTAADDADYSGMYADEANSQIALSDDGANGYKFAGKSNFIKMAIADAAFAEGDMLKMTYTTNPQQGELAIYDGTTKLQGTPYTNNTLTFSDAVGTDKSTLFIRRTDDNKFNGWVAAVEVQRYMDPVIKSFTIGEAVGTIDQVNKTIAVEVPYGTNVTALTPVIAAYANGGATLDKSGAQNFTNPVSYQVSSAYTEDAPVVYTVTVTVADHYEAMIVDGANYETLAAAVAAANANDVVKLLDNVDLTTGSSTGLTIAANITLNLNGFNIKAGEKLNNNINVPAGVKLTLVDNSANAEGKIYTEEAYSGAATGYGVIRVSGEFLMQSGNIYTVIESDPANLGQFAVVLGAGGKATIEGGQIKAGWYAISNNGNNTGSTIIVSGGELISTADYAIYNPAKESTVTVSGGVVYGAAGGIAMNRGELTVTGGTITSKDQGTTGTWGDGTGGLSNAAISASGKYESVEVEISGGTIIAEGAAVMITNGTTNPVEVAISGGQFSHVVPAEYCAPGFAPVTDPNAQGKYEVEDKRIYIFDGSTMSNMATSPSGAIAWAKVGSTMSAENKNCTYDEVSYTKALQIKGSSATKHFRIDVAENNNAKIEVIGMSNSSDETRHTWLTNSTTPGTYAEAIAGLETAGYTPAYFATDWLEEGSYYLHADNSVNLFLIRVTPKAVPAKCEVPTITAQPQTNITFGAGNLTATVEAEVTDFGTLKYQWYNAANDEAVEGATSATLTTTTEGTYYVIVTNTLANHRDNSIKSAEATLGYRVLNDATLSALSASAGTLDPEFDPAEENYTVNLAKGTTTVPTLSATATMHPYATVVINDAAEFVNYEATSTVVVTSEDGTATKTYTVHYVVAHPVAALVDVTENTTWDWSLVTQDANGAAIGSDGPTVNTEDGLVIANYLIGDNFDKIEGNNGAYSIRSSSRKVYQGASLHMHTTKGGYLSIWAANEGTSQTLNVQNAGRDFKLADLTGGQVEYKVYVKAGDVTIYNVPVTAGKPMRVSKMVFTVKETPDYTRNEMLGNGVYGTICLPNNVPAGAAFGATFYELVGREPQYGKLAFDEIVSGELEAGKPYVFQAHGDALEIFYGATHVDNPVDAGNGMYGTFVDQTLTDLDDVYYFAQRALWSCVDLTSLSIPANRAYVKLSEIDYLTDPNPAPGRIRMMMNVNGAPTVITGCENLDASETPVKVMINGQMFILRGEKMYDATGRLVK